MNSAKVIDLVPGQVGITIGLHPRRRYDSITVDHFALAGRNKLED